jgi:hypothetical protein
LCCGFVFIFLGAVVGAGLAALNAFLQRSQIEQQLHPNQAITNSLKSALTVWGLSLLPLLLIVGLGYVWLGREGIFRAIVIISWFLPVILLYFGGLAFMQHYCLRFSLLRHKVLPAQTVAYLDDMDDRLLLRRVGGSWVFVHRALMDYFATLDGSSPEMANQIIT